MMRITVIRKALPDPKTGKSGHVIDHNQQKRELSWQTSLLRVSPVHWDEERKMRLEGWAMFK